MCLDLKERSCIQTAKRDIVVYKLLIESETYLPEKTTQSLHGKSFTAKIKGHECEGKISIKLNGSIFVNQLFLCTNNEFADGRNISEKFGYSYSWIIDKHVSDLVIEGETLPLMISVYETLYQLSKVEIGKTYKSTLIRHYKGVDVGLHSMSTIKDCATLSKRKNCKQVIVKCLIPKGSKYYVGTFNIGYRINAKSFASDTLVYVKVIK